MPEDLNTNQGLTTIKANSIPTLRPLKKQSVYTQFILWSAMPPMEQTRLGMETQKAFCEYYNVTEHTVINWKTRPDFQPRVRAILKMWAFDKTPGVIQGIYRSAIKGNSDSQRIWLQYFEDWTEKSKVEHTVKVEVTVNDIRYLIEALPEPLKQKHYANLRELLDDASAARNRGQIEDSYWTERPALAVPYETDNDAQDLPSGRANVMAQGDTTGVCTHLGANAVWSTFTSQNYNQSPQRWW